jgi:hypothetical protein
MGKLITTSVLALLTKGMGVAEQVLEKSNTKESRKYLDEWMEAKKNALEAENKVNLEKQKPQDQQYDNVVEHFEDKVRELEKLADVLESAAKKELERMLANK